MKKGCMVLGRICLSLFFIVTLATKILNWDEAGQAFAASVSTWVNYPGLPPQLHTVFDLIYSYAPLLVLLGAIFAGLGSVLVFLGVKAELGATLLILCLLPMTVIVHAFWLHEGVARETEMMLFLKNISILGGLFMVASTNHSGGG